MEAVAKKKRAKGKQKLYCNVLAREKGLDPAGYAGSFDDAILIETPLPWKHNAFAEAGTIPQEMRTLLDLWLAEYRETGRYPHRPLLIAPDKNYSVAGLRRVIYYERPVHPFATFHKLEYLIPDDKVGALVWALHQDKAALADFDQFSLPEAELIRDILVCTHGSVDVACAKFGAPVFKRVQERHGREDVRIWRVSHFGGHVFAPTLIDMPSGHYWAYVEEAQAAQIIARRGDVADLRGHYRGWAGLPNGFAQAAEREMWQREGWAWFKQPKAGSILEQESTEEQPQWADVEVVFEEPDDGMGRYIARVELDKVVTTIGSTGKEETYPYMQYKITSLYKADETLNHQ